MNDEIGPEDIASTMRALLLQLDAGSVYVMFYKAKSSWKNKCQCLVHSDPYQYSASDSCYKYPLDLAMFMRVRPHLSVRKVFNEDDETCAVLYDVIDVEKAKSVVNAILMVQELSA